MQQENKVIVKLNCFPARSLCGVSRFFVSDGWSSVRSKIGRCRITTFRQNTDFNVGLTPDLHAKQRGFTLIELLVVVLIIGILASVALPQYTLAVNKSRFANLRTTAESLVKASEIYFTANGEWATDFDSLAVDLPTGMTVSPVSNGVCGTNNEIYCCIIPSTDAWAPAITCGKNDYAFAFHTLSMDRTAPDWKSYCVANPSDSNAIKLCNSLGVHYQDWGAFTPQGTKGGNYYLLNQ